MSASAHAGIPPSPEQRLPSGADTPPSRHRPGSRHPPGSRPPQADTPREQTPLGADTPPVADPPPREQTASRNRHPPREADASIRSMSGRYASYWNAFFLKIV